MSDYFERVAQLLVELDTPLRLTGDELREWMRREPAFRRHIVEMVWTLIQDHPDLAGELQAFLRMLGQPEARPRQVPATGPPGPTGQQGPPQQTGRPDPPQQIGRPDQPQQTGRPDPPQQIGRADPPQPTGQPTWPPAGQPMPRPRPPAPPRWGGPPAGRPTPVQPQPYPVPGSPRSWPTEPSPPARDVKRRWWHLGRHDRRPEPATSPPPANDERYLLAHLPYRAPQHTDISLTVRICRRPANWASATAPVHMPVPAAGTNVTVLVHATPGLLATGPLEQILHVPPDDDSIPLRFAFQARQLGPQRVRVLAFAGGTFLTELDIEVSVEPGGPTIDGDLRVATLTDVEPRRGEVTLQVRSEGNRTVFQLLSDSYLFEPVLADATAGDPPAAVERAIGTLRQLALGRGPYSAGMARRWMRETGIGLWHDVVPELIKNQYWQLRDHITSFTIATSHDVLPWELLYPLRPGEDDGFLVEQFPVLRRVYGQQRCHEMAIAPATYVVSGHAPVNASQEIDALRPMIGTAGVVDELTQLLDMVDSGQCGPLHFVCHNSFDNASGSSIAMNGGPFVPGLLNSAVIQRSLATVHPLVFVNACRTAGTAPEYSRMIGWAQQFMAAGAGAFVGTLWPVRSDSASVFAQAFYGLLRDGETLGDAAMRARRTAMRDEPDPTWLAYTVYGDPHAHARL